jgi:CHAT domain-containing protein
MKWLRRLAGNFWFLMGLLMAGAEKEKRSDLFFLFTLMSPAYESRQVQQLFTQNLQQLTPKLTDNMKWLTGLVLEHIPEKMEVYAKLIVKISIELYHFQLGNRAQNLEIVIVGYTVGLTVWTKENNPEQWAFIQNSRSITSVNAPRQDIDRERLANLKQDLDLLIRNQIQSIDPSFQLTQQVQSIDFATMQSALPNLQTALIAWYVSDNRIHTFLVTPHQHQPLVISSTAAEYTELDTLRDTYLDSYRTDKSTWEDNLPQILANISQLLKLSEIISRLQQLVPDCNQLILVPHRYLHLLPLHALPLNPAGDCLLDLFPQGVRYAPSIQLLNLAQTWQRPPLQRLFAVQDPTSDLKFTDVEVSTIRQQFDPHVELR